MQSVRSRVLNTGNLYEARVSIREFLIHYITIQPDEIVDGSDLGSACGAVRNALRNGQPGLEVIIMGSFSLNSSDPSQLIKHMHKNPRLDGRPYQVVIYSNHLSQEGTFLGKQRVWGELLDAIAEAEQAGTIKVIGKLPRFTTNEYRPELVTLVRNALNVEQQVR